MLARILTENKNYQDVLKLVSKYFDGATIIKADGLWQGKVEHSIVIEIVNAEVSRIDSVAYKIKKANKQQAVLVQYLQCESKLI